LQEFAATTKRKSRRYIKPILSPTLHQDTDEGKVHRNSLKLMVATGRGIKDGKPVPDQDGGGRKVIALPKRTPFK
jgi:hypothetical protein